MLELSAVVEVEQFRPGGSVANTSYTLSRLGSRVCFLGLIGQDPTGRHFAEDLVAAGVTVTPPTANHRTTEVFTLLGADGTRTMVQSAPAMPSGDDSWVDDGLIEQSSNLILESYACGSHPAACEYAARVAHAAGNRLIISLASRRGVQSALSTLVELIATYQPLVVGNVKEWDDLIASADPHTSARMESTPRVVTRSGLGATYYAEGKVMDSPCQPIPKPTDLSGAGDAFAAGFLHTLMGGGSPSLALAQGHQLGRAVVLSLGPRLIDPSTTFQ
jgi:sugar/nucleoside kinase (ribokinase family)